MKRQLILVVLFLALLLPASAQPQDQSLSTLSITNFQVENDVIFENDEFTFSFTLKNNGTQAIPDLLVKVSEQKLSTRPGEQAAIISIKSIPVTNLLAGTSINITSSASTTAGSKLLILTIVINNIETPPLSSIPLEILTAPVGDNITTLSYLGAFVGVIVLFLSTQWLIDIFRLKLIRY